MPLEMFSYRGSYPRDTDRCPETSQREKNEQKFSTNPWNDGGGGGRGDGALNGKNF